MCIIILSDFVKQRIYYSGFHIFVTCHYINDNRSTDECLENRKSVLQDNY